MSDGTHIEWTEASWNCLRARRLDGQPNKGGGGWSCQRVSPGCEHCYAETINKRLGTGFNYDAKGVAASEHYLDEKALLQPLRWKRGRRIFLSSMTDVFGEWVTDEQLDRIFAVMALSPQHQFQVLTKRAERMREYLAKPARRGHVAAHCDEGPIWATKVNTVPLMLRSSYRDQWWTNLKAERWPLPNVWLGVSAEDQQRWDERVPQLLATPAAVRFVSYEPSLGPVDATPYLTGSPRIDWVIVGGES